MYQTRRKWTNNVSEFDDTADIQKYMCGTQFDLYIGTNVWFYDNVCVFPAEQPMLRITIERLQENNVIWISNVNIDFVGVLRI